MPTTSRIIMTREDLRPFTWRRKEEAERALHYCQSVLKHLRFYEEHWDNLPQEYQ